MRRTRFAEEQVIANLKHQESGVVAADICRAQGTSSATFCKWKARFGGLELSVGRTLKVLADENVTLEASG